MTEQSQNLGGRLPLKHPQSLDESARKLYERIDKTMIPWAGAIPFESKTSDGSLIGPFNPVLYSPEIASRFLDLQLAEQRHTTLSDRIRQVIILTVGAVWEAPYELYAHCAAARHAGIPEDAIQTLAMGGLPVALGPAETIAQRYARALSARHRVDTKLSATPRYVRCASNAVGARSRYHRAERSSVLEICFWPFIVRQHAPIVHPWPCRPRRALPRERLSPLTLNGPRAAFVFVVADRNFRHLCLMSGAPELRCSNSQGVGPAEIRRKFLRISLPGTYVQRHFGATFLSFFIWKCVAPIQDLSCRRGASQLGDVLAS
jgi:4-carboxymuconolactone decarboxylase